MFEKFCTLQEIIEFFIKTKPNSMLSRLFKVVGLKSTIKIFESFQGKKFYIPAKSSFLRTAKVIFIQKRLNKLEGEEREKMIQQLSQLFNLSGRIISKMEESETYYRK